ncbi:MAG: EAL domain-containing protein [Hyphomicrobiales bacterium]|nr:MAG: EAL domain-containing protein [Hyphomicrobiales bacterium]
MARQKTAGAPSAGARFTDAFVIFAVTVVSLAIGAFLLLRIGLHVWTGLATALGIYAFLLMSHLIVRRGFQPKPAAAVADDEMFDPWAHEKGIEPQLSPSFGKRGVQQPAAPAPALEDHPDDEDTDAGPDPFTYRPADIASLTRYDAPPQDVQRAAPPPPLPPQAAEAVRAPTEFTVEMIEGLVKKLADELNTAPATPPKVRGKLVPQQDGDAMIDRSIAALESVAQTMRATPQGQRAPKAPATAQAQRAAAPNPPPPAAQQTALPPQAAAPQPPAAPTPRAKETQAVSPQLIRVAEALAAERMEVLLEPIQSLTEGRTRHFEVSTRLLMADGAALDQDEVTRIALGSGLMPRIDMARILRAARVARRLGDGGRNGSVLTSIAGESLTDHRFLSTASGESKTGSMRLVISFQQAEVRIFSPGHVQTLSALAASGFSFALDGVTDLDMDFGELKRMGFEFVNLDAPVFLEGLPAPSGLVPAADIVRMLTEHRLGLIVGHIDDDWQLARILGFGVLLGRGSLFGAPRLVKQEVVAAPPNAVA